MYKRDEHAVEANNIKLGDYLHFRNLKSKISAQDSLEVVLSGDSYKRAGNSFSVLEYDNPVIIAMKKYWFW